MFLFRPDRCDRPPPSGMQMTRVDGVDGMRPMTTLVRPDHALAGPWAAMMADFGGWAEAHGSGYWVFDVPPATGEKDCATFVDGVLAAEVAAAGRVPNTHFWIADG